VKINWREKLSSRKFWCAIAAVIIAISGVIGLPEATTSQVIKIVSAVGALVVFIIGQSCVDAVKEMRKETED